MSEKNPIFVREVLAAAICSIMLAACGGGGSSSNTTTVTDSTTDTGTTTTNSEGETISSVTTGIEVPSEISAVPTDTGSTSTGASLLRKLSQFTRAQATSDLASTSDYAQATPSIYVEERALEQFDIIEEVFGALAQTNYADAENVNQGPYQAVIGWEGEENGKDIKQLQTWTVESRMIVMDLPSDVTGNTTGDTNRLLAWIPERDRSTGEEELIKAEFLIYSAPDKAEDGSLINYGEWDMNVLMAASAAGVDTIPSGGATNFFAASARIDANGTSTLEVHDRFTEDMGGPQGSMTFSEEMKGILVRDGASGYGKVSYPDWDACWGGDGGDGGGDGDGGDGGDGGGDGGGSMSSACESGIPTNVAQYAYNGNYLGVQEINDGTSADAVYKDRNLDGAIRIVHRYGLFYADANTDSGITEGDDVERSLSFGFPVTYQGAATGDSSVTFDEFAYYGAWQGRHQLWGPSGITATTDGTDGTTLTRQDVRPGQTASTYKLKEFNGTFTMRSMVDASLADIQNIPVETFLNDHYDMFYKTDGWYFCDGGYIDWGLETPICRPKDNSNGDLGFTALAGDDGTLGNSDDSSVVGELALSENERRHVNIGTCNENGCSDLVFLASDPSIQGFSFTSAGFYPAEWGERGSLRPSAGGVVLAGADGMNIWVNIGGSAYVAYTGEYSGPTTTTGWVMKTLSGFDESTWTPTFASNGDTPFTPERGYEYYMHTNGQNYIVTRVGDSTSSAAAYSARLELQTAANPANTDTTNSVLPTGTSYLAMPWNPDVKLTLESDPTSTNYLLLVVASDATGTYQADALYAEDTWGLTAFNSNNQPLDADGTALIVDEWGWVDPQANNDRTPVQFNYEYAGNDGNSWGKQQFLLDMSDNSYVILSDPINLSNVTLVDNLGNAVTPTVSLQFDGWMHGLPDMYRELERNNWSIEGLGEKVRRLTEGQEVSDSTGTRYFVKPMEMSLFLGVITAFPNGTQPDISAADAVDLDSVPDYSHHEMGATPTANADGDAIEIKYSEGKALTAE